MVAVVMPLARFCGASGCTRHGSQVVLDSDDRQWGGQFCATHAEDLRGYINDWEMYEALRRTSLGELLTSA